jgi:hypothetical protein
MILEFWCKASGDVMDFKRKVVEFRGRIYGTCRRVFPENVDADAIRGKFVFAVDSRLYLIAKEKDVSKVESVILNLDKVMARITVSFADNDAYVFRLEDETLRIIRYRSGDVPNDLIAVIPLKPPLKSSKKTKEIAEKFATFKVEVFRPEEFEIN